MVDFCAYAYPLAKMMVMVAGHMGHQGLAAVEQQRVQKLRATKRFANDLGFDQRGIVVDDVVSAQEHIASTHLR